MTLVEAITLGLVEGLTEFLPISSTGHLIIAKKLLGLEQVPSAFEVVIQAGAILAVLSVYWRKVFPLPKPQLLLNLVVAFLPAAALGFLFSKAIKAYLFGWQPVLAALLVGGVILLWVEYFLKNKAQESQDAEPKTWKTALGIGLFQTLALWPGTSRSLATILGGRILGLSARGATEFSFLLALPTLLAATIYDFLKHHHELMDPTLIGERPALLLGAALVTAFVSALLVIKAFLKYLEKYSLNVFAYYRIAISIVLYLVLS
jgi:undecaprenyl-diphosphatase